MRTIPQLVDSIHQEAQREPFPIDTPIYEKAGKDPLQPILFAGSLTAPPCVFGRDLGKDEVAAGQPLIGAGGRLVRSGIYQARHGEPPPKSDRNLESVLSDVLLTNTVPYKPPGNKAYTTAVKERFRPFVAELLAVHWQGNHVITLGNEAFQWFLPYTNPSAFEEFWNREDRYEAEIECDLTLPGKNESIHKALVLLPLPHPSPLNARWYKRFPELLAKRLERLATPPE
ncbi:uracil-DNA glycosylase family protein [Singulisphaera acidiphila]|uniref:Uracil-DNA glycosylase n=1 Tax=Singulisphaera acidiphila (strain ATCC BAA-1392 / DSM 18658 / VKM B-2454 / MOB10) TaxID=886293 RepID=L0DNB1_SINAD|nr:uracil-DNA glycosylase family protein [Singulisphaera acidiphila]AGA30166.1 uracil-DNA glycosylase [Singulisphaera acidiphila DSM 18658]